METLRKPLQGIKNIIRFNWHFYVIAFLIIVLISISGNSLEGNFQLLLYTVNSIIIITIIISLIISMYIYDFSGLYRFNWIERNNDESLVININAGFDETSNLLKQKFPNSKLIVFDFYNPERHTEVSIKRARNAYPPYPGTQPIKSTDLCISDNSADKIFVLLAAHEIRDHEERAYFFRELKRIIKPTGQIYITEHLRDLPNFLAYFIGFFHFFTKKSWLKIFTKAGLEVDKELKITPFISTFILNKNGTVS